MIKTLRVFFLIVLAAVISTIIALPTTLPIHFEVAGRTIDYTWKRPPLDFTIFGSHIHKEFELKEGLDIQGGMQIVLRADMRDIPEVDRVTAHDSVKGVIQRRVDMFGVSEPVVQTSRVGDDYRVIVELAGIKDPTQALQLIGTTAQLDFRLQDASPSAEATQSAMAFFSQFKTTGLNGKDLRRSAVQFDEKTGQPNVSLEFNEEGTKKFAEITQNHIGEVLAIFLDETPVTFPKINTAILNGQAVITGTFSVEEAKQLSIQLNAGALPVPIEVIEQRSVGASLGQESVKASVRAGLIGIIFVMIFMVLHYGWKGLIADMALLIYATFTITAYKLFGVTLTLPGIAGLLLSIGMAVDTNILIFERMKEELRSGKGFHQAMELGFGRAWDSIKDANFTTIFTALVLINPMDLPFLNTSGLVRGFGVTLLIGVLISLFTGMVVTRTFMRLFLKGDAQETSAESTRNKKRVTGAQAKL
jgi:preprotein translocase subunit SecD